MFKTLLALTVCIKLIHSGSISSCPKFQCQSATNTTCAYVSEITDKLDYNMINLFDTCKDNQYCNTKTKVLPFEVEGLIECANVTFRNIRYPGEDCDQDEQCYAGVQQCVQATKKCKGYSEGQQCTYVDDCIVGLYCDSGYCKKQKGLGEACQSSIECQNALLCYNDTCSITPYSLPIGEVFSSDEHFDGNVYCNRMQGSLDIVKNLFKCAALNQTVPEGEEYVKCAFEEICRYTIDGLEATQTCGCGLNADGQGYCPQGQNLSKNYIKC
jgi:hypothetical protein